MSRIIPVILAGGRGTRLWPLSREHYPKQFYPLLDKNTSLLQQTLLRAKHVAPDAPIIIVTAAETAALTESQAHAIDPSLCKHIIAEPAAKNTAAASFIAAIYAERLSHDAVLWIQPCDHYITDPDAVKSAITQAARLAQNGSIVTLGMRPQEISESYGYITATGSLQAEGAYRVQQFIEKPEREVAKSLMQNPLCFVNSGMFVLRADLLNTEARNHAPQLLSLCETAFNSGGTNQNFFTPKAETYAALPALPIDKAIMEKSDKLLVIPAAFDWADIGSWDRLWQALPKDESGNAVTDSIHLQDSHNNLIFTGGKRTVCLGVENLIIIDNEDTLLIAHKDALGGLKEVLENASLQSTAANLKQPIENE